MAPKASRFSGANSQESKLKGAFKTLCEILSGASQAEGIIKSSNTLNAVNEILRAFRKNSTLVSSSNIIDLAAALENEDGDLCSKIEPSIFATIVQAILQAEHCLEGERILHLLAHSLVRDTNETQSNLDLAFVTGRKAAIGKECLRWVLEYFVNTRNPANLRRWVGILCMQLLRNCEDNLRRLEMSGESIRRNIGQLILEETNEIVKIICGSLVRNLHDAGVALQDLWPVGADKILYESFPPSTQTGHGWNTKFQDYIDRMYIRTGKGDISTGTLIPVSSTEIQPPHSFGVQHQNTFMFFDTAGMSILAPSVSGTLDQILDVPLALIEKVTVIKQQSASASAIAYLAFELAPSVDTKCYLDGEIIDAQKVTTNITANAWKVLREDLTFYCPGVDVLESDETDALPTSSDNQNGASQRSTGYSEIIGKTQNNPLRDTRGSTPNTWKSKARLNTPNSKPQGELDDVGNSSMMDSTQENEEPMIDTPAERNGGNDDAEIVGADVDVTAAATSPVEENISSTQIQTQSRRVGNKVKPKAKPPIIPDSLRNNGKALGSQQMTSKPVLESKAKSKPTAGDQKGRSRDSAPKAKAQSQPKIITKSNNATAKDDSDHQGPNKAGSQLKRVPKASTSASQANSTKRPVRQKEAATKDDKDRSATSKILLKPSMASQVDPIDSDPLTTPDLNDMSTPKMMPPPAKRPNMSTQMVPQKSKDESQSQAKKRYSLHSLKIPTPTHSEQDSAVFDIPDDGDDDEFGVDAKGGDKKKSAKGKQTSKKATTTTDLTGKTTKGKTKPARKSAPAVLQPPATSTRHSQRAAATKAKTKLHDGDESNGEDQETEEVVSQKAKPGQVQKSKEKAADKMQMTPVEEMSTKISELKQRTRMVQDPAKKAVEPKQNPAVKPVPSTAGNAKLSAAPKEKNTGPAQTLIELNDQDMLQLQSDGPTSSPVIPGPVNGTVDDDDLYSATPKKSQSKAPVAPATSGMAAAAPANRPTRKSGIEMASKLDTIFGDLDDDDQVAVPITNEPKVDNPTPKHLTEEKPAGGKTSLQADIDMADAENPPSRKTKPVVKVTAPLKEKPIIPQESPKPAFYDVPEFASPILRAPVPSVSHAEAATKLDSEGASEQENHKPTTEEAMVEAMAESPDEPDVAMAGEAAEPVAVKPKPKEVDTGKEVVATKEKSEKVDRANKKRKAENAAKTETAPSKRHKPNEHEVANAKEDAQVLTAHTQTASKQEGSKQPRIPKSIRPEVSKLNEGVQRSETQAKTATVAPKQEPPKKSRSSNTKPSSPVRRSPRLEKAKSADETPKDVAAEKPLMDDKVFRKPPIISFGAQGPLNQGRSSTRKSVVNHSVEAMQHSEETPQSINTTSSRKRKHDEANLADVQSPPSKRRESPIHISGDPIEIVDSPVQDVGYQDDDSGDALLHSSPPPDPKTKARPTRSRQASSQGSRVDVNGSPLAPNSVPIDHISKLKQRLVQDKAGNGPVHANGEEAGEGSAADQARPRRISEIFGPKVTLGARSKAQPSSPEEVNTRYVAHEKTDQGQYTEIASKEVIAHGKPLPDPFADKSRKSSNFTDRLRASAVKRGRKLTNEAVDDRSQVDHDRREQELQREQPKSRNEIIHDRSRIPQDHREQKLQFELPEPRNEAAKNRSRISQGHREQERQYQLAKPRDEVVKERSRAPQEHHEQARQYELPKLPRDTPRVHFPQEKNGGRENRNRQSGFDPEQTLVDPKHRYVDHLSEPSDMTNGPSYHSESSDSSREPLSERPVPNEEWNMALRPHYKSLSDAVHRVADEVIIRLSDEEDRMELMVEQYRKNGGKIMENLTTKRNDERTKILQSLDSKKQEMTTVYTEAKGFIQESADDLKENQVTRFEKVWRKQQDDVRKQISDGRKVSES
ncbi:uncharacterized protein PAC_00898 [Phialocephala subalpina]|uniref:Uncharacterized protein n=1 Tax=Phialocephala subalpina TaxID=576137 RepID=A0A1L7WE13_9HELO|nr:uncharacterized protein PAC_00898 [Phialocephala subalpina]